MNEERERLISAVVLEVYQLISAQFSGFYVSNESVVRAAEALAVFEQPYWFPKGFGGK